MTKKIIQVILDGEVDIADVLSHAGPTSNGDFDSGIQQLISLKAKYEAKGFSKIRFYQRYQWDTETLTFFAEREETDKEYETRLRREAAERRKKEQKELKDKQKLAAEQAMIEAEEREIYERLKAKFEGA